MGKIKFLDVGCGDTTIIQTTHDTFLIDCYEIENYSYLLPSNKKIKALFITHQHYDHFLGMEYLKDNNFTIDYLIYSPYARRNNDNSVEYDEWQKFKTLASHFENNGSKKYQPYRQNDFKQPWWETSGLQIWIIGPEKSIANEDTRELHDASLVFTIKNKVTDRRCCFAGDASDKSLNWIAKNTNNYCNDILHASHHGSINGADLDFIKGANINRTIISTKSGVHDNVPHQTALSRYKNHSKNGYQRTDIAGTIICDF